MIWFARYPATLRDPDRLCWRCDSVESEREIGLCDECYEQLREAS